jgi:hypothetical protein
MMSLEPAERCGDNNLVKIEGLATIQLYFNLVTPFELILYPCHFGVELDVSSRPRRCGNVSQYILVSPRTK